MFAKSDVSKERFYKAKVAFIVKNNGTLAFKGKEPFGSWYFIRWSLNLEIYLELNDKTCKSGKNESIHNGCYLESQIPALIVFLVIFLSVAYPYIVLLVIIFRLWSLLPCVKI